MGSDPIVQSLNGKHPFLNGEVVLDLSNSVTNTIQTVAGIRSHFDEIAFFQNNWQATNDLTVSIDIKNETHAGQIRFHFSKNALSEIFKKIFSQTADPNNTEINDCLGELSNICSGYAKTKLNEKGFNLQTALPSKATVTSELANESSGPSVIIPFKVLNQECQMQVIVFK